MGGDNGGRGAAWGKRTALIAVFSVENATAKVMPAENIPTSSKELLGYGKWVAISAIAYTAMPYVVRFILAKRMTLT